ncbi:hypothetical protein LAC81_09580 [Ensifer adhaerens]|uniref:hypothetical protein n=1 Tax=Ensifer adhaerens TaxID=106592 RepID=UPI001CBF0350|nr:hypothetical protein [Ensifer adhaerens]MBZ7922034.1 hypothetical protein [Ensifer adhaerens]UAX94423.1 hypothetical protein LAC78_09575 [Ensifer adhaerens]UAY02058.1 hypothetical protein LAC80_09585 [Ensifer adhaerens]UAY09441.1 hypothetical protein LAC81_09580 [Ensifer adhaerens]
MQVDGDWRERLERDYLFFATWVTAVLSALCAAVYYLAIPAAGCPLGLVVVLLGIFPSMATARLTIAFSRSRRSPWQLMAFSSGCGFAMVAGLIGVYVLTMSFASWDPGGYAVAYPVLTHNFLTSGFPVFSGAGALFAGATFGLWLLRDRSMERNSADRRDGAASELIPLAPHERAFARSWQWRAEERYFWLSVLVGPVVIMLPLILLEMIFSPETALGAPKLSWAMLRYYFGGAYAAAISAVLVLALLSNRSRRSAWLAAFFVGLHVGAIFTLLFDYADDTTSSQAFLLPFGGLLGALSAAICAAIWFPDRRGLGAQTAQQAASTREFMRILRTAGFAAPAAAALSLPVLAATAHILGIMTQEDLDSALPVGAIETWLLNYRVFAAVALLTMLLDQFLKSRVVRQSSVLIILSLSAFLVGGAMAHSLSEDVLRKSVPISMGAFLGLGLSNVVAGLSAVFLIRRGTSRRPADGASIVACQ